MIWMDWLIIASVILLAGFVFLQWLPHWRQRLIDNFGLPASELHLIGVSQRPAKNAPISLNQHGGGSVDEMEPSGAEVSLRCRRKFEELAQGASNKDASLWKSVTALAFANQANVTSGSEHSQFVSKLSAQIAAQMRLTGAEVEEIRLAGIVHDIGKTHVPDTVQMKPTRLTPAEFEIMKSHASWGEWMLQPLHEDGLARIVRHHHERFDGRGYPDRLHGEEIPLGSRIVAVAESFDSMVSAQVYRAPTSFEEAVAEICRCSNSQFDPKVVMAFLEQVKTHGDPRTMAV
jgi:putative nucleotidyltransferase with HDIG domain